MITTMDKFLVSLLPLVTMIGGWAGFEVTPEWWQAVVMVVTPLLVWLFPNKQAGS